MICTPIATSILSNAVINAGKEVFVGMRTDMMLKTLFSHLLVKTRIIGSDGRFTGNAGTGPLVRRRRPVTVEGLLVSVIEAAHARPSVLRQNEIWNLEQSALPLAPNAVTEKFFHGTGMQYQSFHSIFEKGASYTVSVVNRLDVDVSVSVAAFGATFGD